MKLGNFRDVISAIGKIFLQNCHCNFFLIFFQGLLMLISLSIAQEEIEETGNRGARLRLRRPRPIGISDPDGIAEGRPIPLRRIPQGKFLFN